MNWWEKNSWRRCELDNEASQKRLEEQNAITLPVVQVVPLMEYGDNRYLHFAVETEKGYVVVLGGGTRYGEALKIARAIHAAYQKGVDDERNRMRGILGL